MGLQPHHLFGPKATFLLIRKIFLKMVELGPKIYLWIQICLVFEVLLGFNWFGGRVRGSSGVGNLGPTPTWFSMVLCVFAWHCRDF